MCFFLTCRMDVACFQVFILLVSLITGSSSDINVTKDYDRTLDWMALSVINLDIGVQLGEPSDIICLINVSQKLMNIHAFHLTGLEESVEKK